MSILQMMMAGLSLEYEGVISSGDLHIATRDGEAMFFHDSIDFSAYAGTDAGSTPYRLVFTDSAGKVATAYGGAAGGGEALTEVLPQPLFDSAAQYDKVDAGVSVSGGVASFDTSIGTPQVLGKDSLVSIDSLYKRTLEILTCTSAGRIVGPYGGNAPSDGNRRAVGVYSAIANWCLPSTENVYFYASDFLDSPFIGTIGGVTSCQKYTDIPATGLHLMSTKNGTTRNMASVETGFNPNAIVGVKIYG